MAMRPRPGLACRNGASEGRGIGGQRGLVDHHAHRRPFHQASLDGTFGPLRPPQQEGEKPRTAGSTKKGAVGFGPQQSVQNGPAAPALFKTGGAVFFFGAPASGRDHMRKTQTFR
jgi:hypothetical protein